MIEVNDIKNGMTLLIEGQIYQVIDFLHVKPGKGAAFMKTKLKNLRTGGTLEKTFNTSLKFEKANLSIEKINDIITLPVGIRRRANLKIDFGCNVGFYKHASNDVVSVKYCQMLCDEINNVLKYLPIIFKTFVKRSDGSIFITKVENGLTFHFENINITPLDLPKLKAFAQKFNIIQIFCFCDNFC